MTLLRDRCTILLGEGRRRRVYAHPDDPALVVKVAKTDLSKTWIGARRKGSPRRVEADYSNPGEWAVWNRTQGTDLERLFVPCVSISEDGIELVQFRAQIRASVPPAMPAWLLEALDRGHTQPDWRGFGVWNGASRLVDYAEPDLLTAIDRALR